MKEAPPEDGEGPSVRDIFCRKACASWVGQNVACDQYHRWQEDLWLTKEAGI